VAFGGPPVPVLFVHGDRDRVVPTGAGEAAYEALPWPKRMVTVRGGGHGQYLKPAHPEHRRVTATILAFLCEKLGWQPPRTVVRPGERVGRSDG
jgi:pimeloyl-ACP methyl ester carboxylesterase